MVLKNGNEIPDEPIIDDEDPPVIVEQIITPIITDLFANQQFDYSETDTQKIYVRVNNKYKQTAIYLYSSHP